MASDDPTDRTGWTKPGPEHLPSPGFWPAGLALGIVFFVISPAYEYVVSYVFVATGLLMMGFSLRGWLLDIRKDIRSRDD
ncbi:MAG: hypothetical protein AAF436_10135 [Myxococcota bacterium]